MFDYPGEPIIDSRYLQTCDIHTSGRRIEPFTLVILGGGGDLSRRKLTPSLFHLFHENELPEVFSVLAFDRLDLDDAGYRAVMEEEVKTRNGNSFDKATWDVFSRHLFYFRGIFEDDASLKELKGRIDQVAAPTSKGTRDVIYYRSLRSNSRKNYCI